MQRSHCNFLKNHYPEVKALRDADLSMLEYVKQELSDFSYPELDMSSARINALVDTVEALHQKIIKLLGV